MHELINYIDRQMREYENEVARGGELSAKDLECLKDLAKTKMAILTNEAMEDDGRYSYRRSRDGMSERRYYDGRSYARKRDSMGRYTTRGYSYDDAKEDMIADLHEVMNETQDEKLKSEVKKFISKVENM